MYVLFYDILNKELKHPANSGICGGTWNPSPMDTEGQLYLQKQDANQIWPRGQFVNLSSVSTYSTLVSETIPKWIPFNISPLVLSLYPITCLRVLGKIESIWLAVERGVLWLGRAAQIISTHLVKEWFPILSRSKNYLVCLLKHRFRHKRSRVFLLFSGWWAHSVMGDALPHLQATTLQIPIQLFWLVEAPSNYILNKHISD